MERGKRIGINPTDDAATFYHQHEEPIITEEERIYWEELMSNPKKLKDAFERIKNIKIETYNKVQI